MATNDGDAALQDVDRSQWDQDLKEDEMKMKARAAVLATLAAALATACSCPNDAPGRSTRSGPQRPHTPDG